uniref:Protein farnesyltransferase subunit beta n=1 Tax=Onchocerca volvulus TaxID=6282 RepID=A0A8R1Y1I7_ONCVO
MCGISQARGAASQESMDGLSVTYKFSAFDEKHAFDDDGLFTYSSTEQKRVEELAREQARKFFDAYLDSVDDDSEYAPILCRTLHTRLIYRSLKQLGKSCSHLDASRPWFCYWGMHSLKLLGASVDENLTSRPVNGLLIKYSGGPGQYPHLATTYGAIMALVSIGTDEAFASIDRKTLKDFLHSVKRADGGFALHIGGEADIRGSYCALAVASITNILDDQLRKDADSWVISCQTYEGGFGGERCCEAHGGYTFCGVAALMLLGKSALIHVPSLYRWLVQKQMKFEGGFQGRTNKLVDGCYSFWQAAVFPLLEVAQLAVGNNISASFDGKALQEYILIACQDTENGGLRDKPDKPSDLYHTCYVLSGLSIAQYYTTDNIVGGEINRLARLSPIYNICETAEKKAREYFGKPKII